MEKNWLNQPLCCLSDEELIEQTKKDKHAFEILYYRYKDKIYNYIWTLLNFNKEEAIGVTTDVFIKAYEYMQKKSIQNVHAFIYRTAHNLAINHIQKNQRNQEIHSDEMIETQSNKTTNMQENIHNKTKKELLHKLLNRLDNKYKDVIYLHYFEHKEYTEIGDILGTNKNTVGTIISRGKQQLTILAKKYGIEDAFIS